MPFHAQSVPMLLLLLQPPPSHVPPQCEGANCIDLSIKTDSSLPAEFGDRSSMPFPPNENTFQVILGPDSEKLMLEST